jgi:hypothetical protein
MLPPHLQSQFRRLDEILPTLLEHHEGEYVLFYDEPIGFFATEYEAFAAAHKRFASHGVHFIVERLARNDTPQLPSLWLNLECS